VDAGALPRAFLLKAQEAVSDAQDAAILRHTTAGSELDAEQAGQMEAAAHRRVDRRQKAVDEAKALVDAGAAAQSTLQPLLDDLDQERRQCTLVESRAALIRELSEVAGAEESYLNRPGQDPPEGYGGESPFSYAAYAKAEIAFRDHFGKSMPVSAMGETAVHRAMGFDHRGRVDVAIHPEDPEGLWLIEYLKENHIPYFAFTHAVKGKATGAHIHIGPMSTRLASGG
jgi:hypothetical protein